MTDKIRKDSSKPHPRINQYPTNKEGLQGIRPTTEDYKAQGVIIPCISPAISYPSGNPVAVDRDMCETSIL